MTRQQAALEFGARVFRAATSNGKSRDEARREAAEQVAKEAFPNLSATAREFVVWALLSAESVFVLTKRPPLLAEGHRRDDTHSASAPAGGDEQNDGGQETVDTQNAPAPVSRRTLAIMRDGPGQYPVYVPGVGMRAIADLTKEWVGYIYHDRKTRRRNAESTEKGWHRVYDATPAEGTLGDVMTDLPTSVKRFLAGELGIKEWNDQVA